MWDSLPDPRAFLASLKRKAGLAPDFWHPDLELRRYSATHWREADGGGTTAYLIPKLEKLLGESGQKLLKSTPLLVVSERLLLRARKDGFLQRPVLVDNATDAAVLAALCRWRRQQLG